MADSRAACTEGTVKKNGIRRQKELELRRSLREMRIVSDQYRQTMTLLILPPEIKPWERDKPDEDSNEGLENTFDRFIRNGQPPVRN